MADMTARFALPFIHPGQAQKEMAHNEALARIDAVLHPVVEAMDIATPPAAPATGASWIVAPAATDAWAGHDGDIAIRTEGGWRFVTPAAGTMAWLVPAGTWVWHDGDAWQAAPLPTLGIMVAGLQVVGERGNAIAPPSGGSTVDTQSRAAIQAIIAALASHGLIQT